MACRIVFEVGLHGLNESPSATIHADTIHAGESVVSEADLLHSLLCCCIGYEGIWCLYLGRPTSISRSVMDVAASRCRHRNSLESMMHTAWVGLCIPMAEISDILNNGFTTHPNVIDRLSELDVELQDWYNNLPSGLAYREMQIADLDATAYGLHMQFCKVQILMHQALSKSSASRKRKLAQTNTDERSHACSQEKIHRQAVYENALRITRLLLTYCQLFGIEEIPSIMLDNSNLAATCLITHLLEEPLSNGSEERDKQWLRILLKTLDAIQIRFPVTKRILSTLKQMTNGTPLQDVFSPPPSHHDRGQGAVIEGDTQGGRVGIGTDLWSSFGIDAGTSNLAFDNVDNFSLPDQFPHLLRDPDRQWIDQQSLEIGTSLVWPTLPFSSSGTMV